MSIDNTQTLAQVQDALDAVEDARAKTGLSQEQMSNLESTSVQLRNVERSIARIEQDGLVATLNADSAALKDLADKIEKSADSLAVVANAVAKAANGVEVLISAANSAAGAGLL